MAGKMSFHSFGNKMKRLIVILGFALLQVMCSSGNYNTLMVKAEKAAYTDNNPLEASRVLIPNVNRKDQDQLLFMMEAGYMLHAAKEYEKSNKILIAADQKADELYKSVSKEVAAFVTNEIGKDYRGEDYERILLNMTIGLNYLMLNDFENAQVEFKKVNAKLGFIEEKSGKKYPLNLMALYLSAVAHAAEGEAEYAYVELKKLHAIQPGIPVVGAMLLSLAKELGYNDDVAQWSGLYKIRETKNIKDKNNLVVIYESGLAPRKVSRGKLLNDPELKNMFNTAVAVAIATTSNARGVSNKLVLSTIETAEHPIPRYVKQNFELSSARFDVLQNGKVVQSMNLLQFNDVENTIFTNFEQHYQNIREKMITRLVTKVVATLVAKAAAEEGTRRAGGGMASLLVGTLAGAGVGAALFASEKPDLRCWHSIPASYHATSLNLAPGKYEGKVAFLGKNGELIQEENVTEFIVSADKPKVVHLRTYK